MNENEKDAWTHFTATGSVADYLKYTAVKRQETEHEDSNGRSGYQGTGREGIGQGDNRSDKG